MKCISALIERTRHLDNGILLLTYLVDDIFTSDSSIKLLYTTSSGLSDDVIVEMDLCSDVSIERAGKELREKIADRPINLLINVSGILHNEELNMFPEKQYSDISSSAMEVSIYWIFSLTQVRER